MALKDFQRIDAEDKTLVKVQENVDKYLRQINPTVNDGLFLEKIKSGSTLIDITIGTSTTLVPHGLGRIFQGWHLLDIQADARVWRDATSTSDPTKFLPLKASASVVVKLWVF